MKYDPKDRIPDSVLFWIASIYEKGTKNQAKQLEDEHISTPDGKFWTTWTDILKYRDRVHDPIISTELLLRDLVQDQENKELSLHLEIAPKKSEYWIIQVHNPVPFRRLGETLGKYIGTGSTLRNAINSLLRAKIDDKP